MANKGKFTPKHPEKYLGDITNIVYRSLLERKVMIFLDTQPNILAWSSEEVIIPYWSPVDRKNHRYFPDFFVKMKQKGGSVVDMLWEVKPKVQCEAPKPRKNITRRFLRESITWEVNSAKWAAAEEFCLKQGWKFVKITEVLIDKMAWIKH